MEHIMRMIVFPSEIYNWPRKYILLPWIGVCALCVCTRVPIVKQSSAIHISYVHKQRSSHWIEYAFFSLSGSLAIAESVLNTNRKIYGDNYNYEKLWQTTDAMGSFWFVDYVHLITTHNPILHFASYSDEVLEFHMEIECILLLANRFHPENRIDITLFCWKWKIITKQEEN